MLRYPGRCALTLALLLPAALQAQALGVELCGLPYHTLPSPEQTASLFRQLGAPGESLLASDSLVEITDRLADALLRSQLSIPEADSLTDTYLYAYGPSVLALTVLKNGVGCSVTLLGPAPERPLWVTATLHRLTRR